MPDNKKLVVVGVCGSIAIYKILDVIRQLKRENIEVVVIMTENAQKFITPLTFQTISENFVILDFFAPKTPSVAHIDLERSCDLLLIAPATANIIGKIASGIGDDALSTFAISVTSPVLIAPAMNSRMWQNKIVQENIKKLKDNNFHIISPDIGSLACGDDGIGRLANVDKIVETVLDFLRKKETLKNKKFLVTAGPTQEAIDPVRFISNLSSGKMGFALAKCAYQRGAEVILITGPTCLDAPIGVKVLRVKTAEEMKEEVFRYFDNIDVLIKSAAVVDFKVKNLSPHKIKKIYSGLTLDLVPNVDILQECGKRKKKSQIIVGFAAETENIVENAKEKLKKKNLDMIVVNNILSPGSEMGSDTSQVKIIYRGGDIEDLPLLSKYNLANEILDRIEKLLK